MSNINKIKRLLIILCFILVIALIVFIFVIDINKEEKNPEEVIQNVEEYENHISYEGVFSIDTPDTWTEVEEKKSLNADGVLELHSEENNAYLVAVVTNKLDLTDDFNTFKKNVFTQKETHYKIKITEYKDVVINGYNSQYIEFYNTNENSINTYIRSYAIETNNYYVQIMIWTLKSNEEEVQEEFNNIIDSFKEI